MDEERGKYSATRTTESRPGLPIMRPRCKAGGYAVGEWSRESPSERPALGGGVSRPGRSGTVITAGRIGLFSWCRTRLVLTLCAPRLCSRGAHGWYRGGDSVPLGRSFFMDAGIGAGKGARRVNPVDLMTPKLTQPVAENRDGRRGTAGGSACWSCSRVPDPARWANRRIQPRRPRRPAQRPRRIPSGDRAALPYRRGAKEHRDALSIA